MLILLEGCDGVGKSYIAAKLAAALEISGPVELLHKGPMQADAITEYERPLEDYLPGCGRHVICDRWHIGELVYGPILRGSSRMKDHERRHIDKFLAVRGAFIVHATTAHDRILRNIGLRGDDLITHEHVTEITDSYFTVLNSYHWQSHIADVILEGDDDQDRDTLHAILNAAAELEVRAYTLTSFSTYIGPSRPRFLLLGERRNEAKSRGQRSAFVPVSGTSGEYLLKALTTDVDGNCGIANACEENIVDLWDTLGRPFVVALGRAAQRECEQAEIPYGTVPHPQAIRRFHNKRATDYGRAIREAGLHRKDMTFAFSHPGS